MRLGIYGTNNDRHKMLQKIVRAKGGVQVKKESNACQLLALFFFR